MNEKIVSAFTLVAMLCTACVATAPPEQQAADGAPAPGAFPRQTEQVPWRTGIELFVTPPSGLHVAMTKDDRGTTLEQLLDEYARLMGWNVFASRDTRAQLRQMRCGLSGDVDIPAERVHGFVEALLVANDFVLGLLYTSDPVLLTVSSTSAPSRGSLRKDASYVPEGEIERWAEHPALLITTTIDLPSTDVRTLSNSLRQMFTDAQTQQIIPVGNSNSLIITGFGSEVAAVVHMLRDVDRRAREMHTAEMHSLHSAGLAPGDRMEERLLLDKPLADLHLLFPSIREELVARAPDGKRLDPLTVLQAFAKWSKRELVCSSEARRLLEKPSASLADSQAIPGALVYGYIGDLLARSHCTLQAVPPAAPVTWRIECANTSTPLAALVDAPFVRLDELATWAAFRATAFSTMIQLPEDLSPEKRKALQASLALASEPCILVPTNEANQLGLCGTPQAIWNAVGTIHELRRGK